MVSDAQFRALLASDEREAFECERFTEAERRARRLARPATNLGVGRGRFRHLFERLDPLIEDGAAICDVGVYPGTTVRIARGLAHGGRVTLTGVGLGFSEPFKRDMERIDVGLHELEFDVKRPPADAGHLLSTPIGPFDGCVCTEVIEHQFQPTSLLVGLNRLTRTGGTLLLTTNSVGFIGDVARLLVGRHNVEALERSHVVSNADWQPHIRLFTLAELRTLVARAGFEIDAAYYFDNGNVYSGLKGAAMTGLRAVSGRVPHMRSHIFVAARRRADPDQALAEHLRRALAATGLDGIPAPAD